MTGDEREKFGELKAASLQLEGQPLAALKVMQATVVQVKELAPTDAVLQTQGMLRFADLEAIAGQRDDAIVDYRAALSVLGTLHPPEPVLVADAERNLATLLILKISNDGLTPTYAAEARNLLTDERRIWRANWSRRIRSLLAYQHSW